MKALYILFNGQYIPLACDDDAAAAKVVNDLKTLAPKGDWLFIDDGANHIGINTRALVGWYMPSAPNPGQMMAEQMKRMADLAEKPEPGEEWRQKDAP